MLSLLNNLPASATEVFEDLAQLGDVRIERITTPPQSRPGPLYVQAHAEWVLILQGWADLEVESETHRLNIGDAFMLPARIKHRVLRTSPEELTVWLALHADN